MNYVVVNSKGRILRWASHEPTAPLEPGEFCVEARGIQSVQARSCYYNGSAVVPKRPSTVRAPKGPWSLGDTITLAGIPARARIELTTPSDAFLLEASSTYSLSLDEAGDYEITIAPVEQEPFELFITVT